jgi:hypothetical protein
VEKHLKPLLYQNPLQLSLSNMVSTFRYEYNSLFSKGYTRLNWLCCFLKPIEYMFDFLTNWSNDFKFTTFRLSAFMLIKKW